MQIKICNLWFVLLVSTPMLTSCLNFSLPHHITPTPSLEPTLTDRSLLTGVPCDAPCWYRLELGISDEDAILTTLQTLSFVDPTTIREYAVGYWDPIQEHNVPAKLIVAGCKEPKNQQCVGLTIANGNLKIVGLFPNYTLTLGEVVNRLGPPDYIVADSTLPVHNPSCSISLTWKKQQIKIDHIENTPTSLCSGLDSSKKINPTLLVYLISYYLPEYIDLGLESGAKYPWPGFSNP